jgi:hypothetical protein
VQVNAADFNRLALSSHGQPWVEEWCARLGARPAIKAIIQMRGASEGFGATQPLAAHASRTVVVSGYNPTAADEFSWRDLLVSLTTPKSHPHQLASCARFP